MNVTDEMQEKLERKQPFGCRRCWVLEFGPELINFVHNAIVCETFGCAFACWDRRMAKACLILIRRIDLDVDEMPLACRLIANHRRVPVGIAVAICPGS